MSQIQLINMQIFLKSLTKIFKILDSVLYYAKLHPREMSDKLIFCVEFLSTSLVLNYFKITQFNQIKIEPCFTIIITIISLANQNYILLLITTKSMLSGSSSTRNKITKSNQKSNQVSSKKFFKKPLAPLSDQNQKNYINYLEKIVTNKQTASKAMHSLYTLTPLAGSLASLKKNPKQKTSTVNLTSKPIKTMTDIHLSSTHNKENLSRQHKELKQIKKEHSAKNLKLSSGSVEFPKLLTKSISQTTMNRKIDDNKLKMFEKIGMRKKLDKIQKKPETPKLDFQNININQFKLGKKLGSGRFGCVFFAEQKQTGSVFAIKVMNKIKIKEAQMQEQIVQEIKLQTYMNHPNVLKLYGFFHDSKNIYLILEYCNKCLFKQLRQKGKFTQEQTAYYSKQCIASLKYMHNQNIIHRDIKPENILIQNEVIKMSDFGWSTYAPVYKRQTFCGTVDYVPPQIVEGNSYDERVDIWAVGVLLYQLASGMAPFETKDENITYEKILKSQCIFPEFFSNQLKSLINKILDKNPSKRPNFDQIESHDWFEKYKTTGRFIRKDIWAAWNSLN